MKEKNKIIFWFLIILILIAVFSVSLNSFELGFYFVSFLFPIVIGTSVFFNRYLVPRYLLTGRKWKFGLYFSYMVIVSIYLELMIMILAFVILANYQIKNLGNIAGDIYLLTAILYLIVLVDGFITVIKGLKLKSEQVEQLEKLRERNEVSSINVKVNRKNVKINTEEITVIESLSDYVKIHTLSGQHITKQKISHLQEALPEHFLRIHRSFLINRGHIQSFNREQILVNEEQWPIGRKYKKECMEVLNETWQPTK